MRRHRLNSVVGSLVELLDLGFIIHRVITGISLFCSTVYENRLSFRFRDNIDVLLLLNLYGGVYFFEKKT